MDLGAIILVGAVLVYVAFRAAWFRRHSGRLALATQQELERSRARLAEAERIGGIGHWHYDPIGNTAVWSDGFFWLVGHQPGSFPVTFQTFLTFVHPDDRQGVLEAVNEVRRTRTRRSQPFRTVWPDGTIRHLNSSIEVGLGPDGSITELFGTAHDITESEAAGHEIARSVNQLRTVLQAALDGIVVTDQDGMIEEFNPAAETIFGWPRAEALGKPVRDLIIPERLRPVHQAAMDRYVREGGGRPLAVRLETIGLRADGTEFPVELGLASALVDGRQIFTANLRDITSRVIAQQRLSESESRFRQMAESIDQVFWLTELEPVQRHLYLSPAFTKLWGIPVEDCYARADRWLDQIHSEDRPRVEALLDDWIAGKAAGYECEYRITRPDGEVRWIIDTGALILNQEGRRYRISRIAKDVTPVYQAKTAQAELEVQLRHSQKMEAIGTLAGGIAHDFNNLLGVILGSVELAQFEVAREHPAHRHLNAIGIASSRASGLIRQILAFSRPGAQERDPISLAENVAEAIQLIRATIPATVAIDTDFPPRPTTVVANPSDVHQAVMNLCTNAWHALEPRGGTIRLTITELPIHQRSPVGRATLEPGRYLRLSVADDGCGMEPAVVERMFEPFFTTKPPGKGSGLGMAVVHGIMQAVGGGVRVDSAPGRGTTVELYFPAARTQTPARTTQSPNVPMGAGQRILFVDDEEILVRTAGRMLERLGYRVTTAANAKLALERVEEDSDFELVITDLAMPGRSGLELAADLGRVRPGLPVVLVSGFIGGVDPKAITAAGFQAVVQKPLSFDNLAGLVSRVLGGAGAPAQA